MKKLFMIAAVAALGLGAYSCQNGPGDDPGKKPVDGSETGMKVSIKMPSARSFTRAGNFGNIDATAAEDKIQTIDIWVFDENGVAPDDAALHHKRFTVGDFGSTTTDFVEKEAGGGLFEMKDPWRTLSGEVRVWVGANLPAGMNIAFEEEEDLLEVSDNIAALSSLADSGDPDHNPVKGLAFFSNAVTTTFALIPTGSTFEEENDDPANPFNTITVPIFRVVSKAVATNNKEEDADKWAVEWTDNGGMTLTYTPTHWRVMQYAYETWDAPHYDVATFNGGATAGGAVRPITYADVPTPGGIASYNLAITGAETAGDETGEVTELYFGEWDGTDGVLSGYAVANKLAKYIGENSRIGAEEALNLNTTFAYISAGVTADKKVVWDNSTNTLVWEAVDTPYGMLNEDNTGDVNTDIIVIHWDGKQYLIPATVDEAPADNTDDGLQAIIKSIAERIMGASVFADDDAVNEAIEVWKAAPGNAGKEYPRDYDGPTLITMKEFKDDQDFASYTYPQGYVHFIHWINPYNEIRNNQYEIFRNQFVHLNVGGMNQENDGVFPGYPGDDEYPRIPIDPTEDENNPDPLEPNDPVDPAPTDVKVNVEVMPWTYRVNDIILQR